MHSFQYHRVSREFINDLHLKVRSAESVVLLGARYGGKRYVIGALRRLLEETKVGPIIEVRFLSETPISMAAEARKKSLEAVKLSGAGFVPEERKTNDLLDPVEQMADYLERPVILLATNVDGLAHHLARGFLRGVRTLVDRRKVVAVMSGEEDFHDLVYGENSEFTCANQMVLQGYEEEEFNAFVRQHLRYISLRFEPEDEVLHLMWDLTGGNIYTMRIILWTLVQTRSRKGIAPETPVGTAEISATLKLTGISGAFGAHIFRHATQFIDREPDSWESIERLTAGVPVPTGMENAPTTLELSGIAVRKEVDGVEQLVFASQLIEKFTKRYYDHKRMGDLYGSQRKWDKAVERYERLDPEQRMRPAGADDRGAVEMIVGALGSSLYSEATRINKRERSEQVIASLREHFALGCRYVLGFREVTFWHRGAAQQSSGWAYQRSTTPTPASRVMKQIQGLLPTESNPAIGVQRLPDHASKHCILAVLPGLLRDEHTAVVVSDFETETVIWRERDRLIKRLLEHFMASYQHAVSINALRWRHHMRGEHIRIINNIFDMLGSPQLKVMNLLKIASNNLRQLDYKRVVISLVDPERLTIEGIYDDSDGPVKIDSRIHWEIDDPAADVQPYVINRKESYIISDVATDHYVDRKTMAAAGIRAAAVVPIINPRNEAIGTILIERANRLPPSPAEVTDLQEFGRQLAIAIEQCERVNLLEECLNKIPEPLLIFDRTENQRYLNTPATTLFGGTPGWLDSSQMFPLRQEEAGGIVGIMRESLENGHRVAAQVHGIGLKPDYEAEVIADTIEDWRGGKKVAGGLLRIQDRTYLHKHFEAVRRVAEAREVDDVIKRMLEATAMLGHEWGRLHMVRTGEDGVETFVSELCYGQADPEDARAFNEHRVRLAPRVPDGHKDWLCIEQKSPVVFCWQEGLDEGDTYTTRRGLRATNWPDPPQPPQIKKKPGDFWIDFPLYSDKPLGKICLQCDEDLQPEHFEFLKHLSVTFSTILDVSLLRQRGKEESEETIKIAVAQKIMATMAHNIGTRHGSIRPLLDRYRNREKKNPELKQLNDRFEHISKSIRETITRAQEFLSPVNVRLRQVDILGQIDESLQYVLPDDSYSVAHDGVAGPLVIPLDAHLFDTALIELVENSAVAHPDKGGLAVAIKVREFEEGEQPWVEITYEDNGPGVLPEDEPRIFEDFFSHRPNKKKAGTGLGMGFILRVVEGHEGRIRYAGEPGRGARFIITLPRAAATEAGTQRRPDV